MVRIVEGGSAVFDALVYGETHPNTQNFISQQWERGTHLLNEAGRSFYNRVSQIAEDISSSNAFRLANSLKRSLGNMWESNAIRYLSNLEEFQHAKPEMQRWVMTDPFVKKRFQQQRLEGYGESYTDPYPEEVGVDDYNYRRVMNGMVVDTEDGGWTATTWMEDLLPDDRELYLNEKVDILDSWDNIRRLIREGEKDPTSQFDASLD